MYRYAQQYDWFAWEAGENTPPDRDFTGFRAKILVNPTASEVRAESSSFAKWRDFSDDSYGDKEHFQAIAPRVIEWEYEMEDAAGNVAPVPAPGEADGNWEAFLMLPLPLAAWVGLQVHVAHLPKAIAPSSTPAGSTEPPNPTESTPEPEPPSS